MNIISIKLYIVRKDYNIAAIIPSFLGEELPFNRTFDENAVFHETTFSEKSKDFLENELHIYFITINKIY